MSLKSNDFYATIGVQPCRSTAPFSDGYTLDTYFDEIRNILKTYPHKDKFVAIGECGLDYDRLEYADKET